MVTVSSRKICSLHKNSAAYNIIAHSPWAFLKDLFTNSITRLMERHSPGDYNIFIAPSVRVWQCARGSVDEHIKHACSRTATVDAVSGNRVSAATFQWPSRLEPLNVRRADPSTGGRPSPAEVTHADQLLAVVFEDERAMRDSCFPSRQISPVRSFVLSMQVVHLCSWLYTEAEYASYYTCWERCTRRIAAPFFFAISHVAAICPARPQLCRTQT